MRQRLVKILAGVFVALIVAAGVAYFVVLPRIVHQRVAALLRDAGIDRARFDVERATLARTVLDEIVLGADGQVKVDRMSVTYSPAGVARGEVGWINISGLQLVVESKGGEIDLGPLGELDFADRGRDDGGAADRDAADASANVPLRGVHVRDSRVVVRTADQSIEVPVAGDMVARGRTYQVRLQLDLGAPCIVAGTIDADTGAAAVTLDCAMAEADRALAVVHALFPEVAVDLEGALSATASLRWAPGRGVVEARLAATGSGAAEAAGSIEPETLGDANVTIRQGVFKVQATFGPAVEESLKLAIDDATVAGKDFNIEGIEGELHVTNFAAPASSPGQVLRARRLEIGGLELTDGTVQFQLESPTSLAVERTAWNWLGGQVSTRDVQIAAGEPIDLVLNADKIELRQLLDLLAEEHAEGSGRISGQLPLRIAGGDVKFGEGRFSAVGDGQLEIKQAEAIAGAQAEKAAAEPSQGEQVRRNIVEALKDFEYDVLKAELTDEPDGGLSANVRIAGRGRTGARQAIDYQLRVRGLDVLLETLLDERRAIAADVDAAAQTAAGKDRP